MKYTYLHKKFNYKINTILQSDRHDSIIIAISGGQDSICLIRLIEDMPIAYTKLLKIEYIYIDHQWRQDSKNHIKHLINLIKKTSYNISIYEIYNYTTSELEARKLRYQILINHAKYYNYDIIMTGHTETDKIETFFQQLIRGTSIDGATSLKFRRQLTKNIQLYRPLINFNRIEVSWFCRKYCLPIWSDLTNYYYQTKRNRIRYELIPYLNQYFHININRNIDSFLQITNIDNEYLKQNSIKLYLISRHKLNIAINYLFIQQQHKAIQYRTLQLFFYHNFQVPLNNYVLQKIILIIEKQNIIPIQISWNSLKINFCNNWIYIN